MALEKIQGIEPLRKVQANFDTIGERGKHTVVSGDATANAAAIATGKADATSFMVQVYREGVQVGADAVVTLATGTLTVADGSTYNVTAGDVIMWQVW